MTDDRDLVFRFLASFASGKYDDLRPLLAADLDFRGPLARCRDADSYLRLLKQGDGETGDLLIDERVVNGNCTAVLYRLLKSSFELKVAQWFWTRDGRIARIEVVFDASKLA